VTDPSSPAQVGVIVVAAGRGLRAGTATPKQFLDLGGRPMLRRSVDVFDAHPAIRQIVIVLPPELVSEGPSIVGATGTLCGFVAGGARRQDSVRLGVAALSSDMEIVLIHDAARPFASRALIDRVIDAAAENGAALPALPVRDTVKRVDVARRLVTETLPRQHVWLAQTPQGFQRRVLEELMEASDGGIEFTDESMLAERCGHAVRLVEGDERNVKITTAEDLAAARARFVPAPRVGTGYDLHRLVEGRPLVLAGVTVPFDRGPLGHSDGDVLCHALIDAMLGAAGAGDIGQHFPNAEPRWKDAAGLDLLARSVEIVRQAGFAVASADVTIVLERPKLVSYLGAIRQRVADVLGLSVDAVSVKGKTNEGVDSVGRGEAIAAHAVAVITTDSAGHP